jgi:hypothetical protein
MTVCIPEIRVGEPVQSGGIAVFPLFTNDGASTLDYLPSEQAMSLGAIAVKEISDSGSVSELMVDNGGDQPVLFIDGEEVRGGKQNRVFNISVLAPARNWTIIPVSCVQAGRWVHQSHQMTSGTCAPPSVRRITKRDRALKSGRNQWEVWHAISKRHRELGVSSATGDMAATMKVHGERIESVRRQFSYVGGATGIAVAIGNKVTSLDVFDRTAMCERMWGRLVQAAAMDGLDAPASGQNAGKDDVANRLYKLSEVRWEPMASIGLGEHYRALGDDGMVATALVVDNVPIHLAMSM